MKKVCLVIIDGFGISSNRNDPGDATKSCKFIKKLIENEKYVELHASGNWVGIANGIAGNSEVGHLTLGSGRIIEQSILEIPKLYNSGELQRLIMNLPKLSKRIHLVGLLSDGRVHSDYLHVEYIGNSLPEDCEVFIHAISDGIDTQPRTFGIFFGKFTNIVSVSGRYFAMDRDKNWDRTQMSFDMMTKGQVKEFSIDRLYSENIEDEFIEPTLIKSERINPEDTVILFNIRADRMKQIYSKFKEYCTTYTLVEYELDDPNAIVRPKEIKNTLSKWLEVNHKNQAHIAETEKYAHVTYFFNGGKEVKQSNEKWLIVPSPRTKLFSLTPGTSMKQVIEKLVNCINDGFDFIVSNLAATDLVAHTGDLEKTIEACSILDNLIETVYLICIERGYTLLITADHGNSECMIKDGQVSKSHTTNKVPFIAINTELKIEMREHYSLRDVAPTVLKVLNIHPPEEMSGCSILID